MQSFAEMTELLKRKEEGRICVGVGVWVSVGVLVEGDGKIVGLKKSTVQELSCQRG